MQSASAQQEEERRRKLLLQQSRGSGVVAGPDSAVLKSAIRLFETTDPKSYENWIKRGRELATLYEEEFNNPVQALLVYQTLRKAIRDKDAEKDLYLEFLLNESRLYRSIRDNNLDIRQKKLPASPMQVHFRITDIRQKDGKTLLTIDGGSEDGIFEKSSGNARINYSIHKETGIYLGQVQVSELGPNICFLEYVAGQTSYDLEVGDLVELIAECPASGSVLFDLRNMDIVFLNNEEKPVYDRRHFLLGGFGHMDTLLADYFAAQVRETYEYYQEELAAMEAWTKPYSSGRFKGRTPLEAMERTSSGDVLAFLLFVKNYPAKYMGKDWQLNETYATWLQAGAPPSKDEFIADLKRTKDNSDYLKLARIYEKEIREDEFLTYVSMEVESLANENRREESVSLSDKLIAFVNAVGTESQKGWACFSRARIFDILEENEESEKWYQTAIDHFRNAEDYEGLGYSYSNLSGFEKEKLHYEKAIDYLNQALAYKDQYERKNGVTIPKSKAISHNSIGLIYYALGEYDSAILNYNRSIAFYGQVNTVESKRNTGLLYKQIGKCLTAKGNYRDALEIYRRQILVLEKLNSVGDIADVYDEMGYAWYELGDYRTAYSFYDSARKLHVDEQDWNSAGFSSSSMGQMMWNLSDKDSAIELHMAALEYRNKGGNRSGSAYSYTKLGHLYKDLSKPKEATTYFHKALDIYRQLGDSVKMAEVYVDMGELFQSLKDEAEARNYFIPAYELVKGLRLRQETSDYAENIGISFARSNRYDESRKFHEEAYRIRSEIGDRSGQMYSLCNLAQSAWFGEFDPEKAEKLILQAMLLAQELESKDILAYCYQVHGGLKTSMGDTRKAESLYMEALKLYQETGDVKSECTIRLYLGGNEINRGNFDLAATKYREVVKLATENNQDLSRGDAYNYLGEYYYLVAEYDSAFMMADSSIALALSNDNEWLLANAFLTKGNTYNLSGDYRETIRFYEKSDSIYSKLQSRQNRATVINNIGTIHFFQGEYTAALKCFGEVLDILEETRSEYPLKGTAISNIGEVYLEQKLYTDAHSWLEKALTFSEGIGDHRMATGIRYLMGKCYLAEKNYTLAEDLLLESRAEYGKMKAPASIATIQTYIGKLYLEKDRPDYAKSWLDSAINAYDRIGQVNAIWEPLWFRSQVHDRKQLSDRATSDLKNSVASLEEMKGRLAGGAASKRNFAQSGEKVKIYESLVSHLIEAGQIEEAFVYQEKSNVVGLIEQTRGDGTRGARHSDQIVAVDLQLKMDGIYAQLLEEKKKPEGKRSEEKIRKLEEMIRVAEGNYRNYLDSVVNNNPEMVRQLDNIDPRTIKRSMRNMPEELAMIEYVVSGESLLVFVLTREKLEARAIPIKKKDLEEFVDNFYRQIIERADLTVVNHSAEQLYDLMILPIEEQIREKPFLAIAPTGIFYKLPFHSLVKRTGEETRYLIEDYSIAYVNDVRDVERRNQPPLDMRILAFGNTDNSLPNAEMEVNDISKLFSGTVAYIRGEATEDIAKEEMGKYPIVHFATHGVLDPVTFKNSYLTMAPNANKNEDGHLRVEEIRRMDLFECQLVMLSACSTAVNDDKVEGWVNNPAKEFLLSGASSVVASLWKVDDEGTRYLMQSFYTGLKEGEVKAASLRKAQLKLIADEQFRHPYYWSAFELIGYYR